jgi:anti-sigma factor RsiW
MKKCRETQAELSAYIDEELPAAARVAVEEHLRGCGDCQKRLAELRELSLGVMALPRLQPAPGFLTEVRRRIVQDSKPQTRAWRHHLFRPFWLKIPVEAMAVIAVVLLVMRSEHWSNERGLIHKTIVPVEKPTSAPVAAEAEPGSIRKLTPTRLVGRAAPDGSRMKTPAEIVVVRAKDFDEVQNHVRQLAAAMNGRLLPPPPDKSPMRALFVELPPEMVNAFKSQLLTAKLPDAPAQSSATNASNSFVDAGERLEGATSLAVVQVQVLPPAD